MTMLSVELTGTCYTYGRPTVHAILPYIFYIAAYRVRLATRSALQSRKWQMVGMSQW